MQQRTIRVWSGIHKWTSLICTIFMLMLCLTGLPLIFHDEIDAALDTHDWEPANPGGPMLSLDRILSVALDNQPGDKPIFMSFDKDRPVVNVTTAPTLEASEGAMHFASYDRTSGETVPDHESSFMAFILELHMNMFLGLPGMLFLGAMGLLLFLAIVSGVVLYAPFMRKLNFGTVRTGKTRRIKWLDLHNFFGVITVAWLSVVTLTGVVNTLATPIIDLWRTHSLADLIEGYENQSVPTPEEMASLDAAVKEAVEAAPDKTLQFVAFPGGQFSTDFHYGVFLQGKTSLTQHLITPALINARTGELSDIRGTPWYVKSLALSGPLHFGDYGGLPLKILWTILDLLTIIVLVSGLYLWASRRRPVTSEIREPTTTHSPSLTTSS
ncbi:PepSY domain-containing protein [Salicola sp. Rm-C-2C1-2]|uniref:PepSY-associated TM helix domain-containing protein n=1 Tax=Salicola sp. Rm-C-2C1-2 TaxID=3141321 RepID=UPI0032E37D31